MAIIALRPPQEAALAKVREAFRAGYKRVLLYGPTGFGKTECSISFMQATRDKGKRSAMVLDRIVLVNQTSARLQKYGIDHGVMQSGHWRYRPYEPIQVCSAQTLEKRGSMPGTNLMIVDECHAIRQQTVDVIKGSEDMYVVGLSASPFADGLGEIYETVVSAVTTQELVEMGYLVPLRVFIAKEVDMTGAKKVAGEWSTDDAADRSKKITGDVVSTWVAKTHELFGGPVKTIVFSCDTAHSADLAQKFAAAGYNFVPISYKDSDEFKQDVIRDFEKPDSSIHGIISVDILVKGFDNAGVRIGISARPYTKSFMAHVQQMGRVMRPDPLDLIPPLPGEPPREKVKPYSAWICHSGNYLRFQQDWDELYAEGVKELKDGKESAKQELTDKEKERKKCPACGALWIGNGDVCSSCGYHRPVRNTVETVDGEVEELGTTAGKDKSDKSTKQAWYSQLLAIAQERGYSEGWAAHKYREKFQVWPRSLDDTPAPPSDEVLRWEKSRRIAWAKSKATTR